jgi:hypothetical protein
VKAKLIKAKSSQNLNRLRSNSMVSVIAVNPIANMGAPQRSINYAPHRYLSDQVAAFPNNK